MTFDICKDNEEESIGGSVTKYPTKQDFIKKVLEKYGLVFEESHVYEEYWRYHPTASEYGEGAYIPSEKGKRGSFPIWMVDIWEAST
jgi:hypothetical protein